MSTTPVAPIEEEGEPLSDWSLAARELARRSVRWLSLHEAGLRAERNGGMLAPMVELQARIALGGRGPRRPLVQCHRDVAKRDPPAGLRLQLQLGGRDPATRAR